MYYRLGQLMAMALVHGGSAVCLLSSSVYGYLCELKPCDIIVGVDEVPDSNVRAIWRR